MSKTILSAFVATIFISFLSWPATAQEEPIHACDSLAAHEHDPMATTTGVPDNMLDARRIIEVCQSAIQADPEALRFRFQLARGYIADGKKALGFGLIEALANKRYPAAYLLLGIAHHEGDGAILNHRHALKWYKKAYSADVVFAADAISRLYADPQSPLFDIEDSFEWAEKFSSANKKAE